MFRIMDGQGEINIMTFEIVTYVDKEDQPSEKTRETIRKLKENTRSRESFLKALKEIEAEITKKLLLKVLMKHRRNWD